jgi:hypothetical protein
VKKCRPGKAGRLSGGFENSQVEHFLEQALIELFLDPDFGSALAVDGLDVQKPHSLAENRKDVFGSIVGVETVGGHQCTCSAINIGEFLRID